MTTDSLLPRIASGETSLVPSFLESGGSPSALYDGVPLMQWCAYHGDVNSIRLLLQHGAQFAELGVNLDLNGAAFHGYAELCEFLLQNGADPNLPMEETGETPLHAAACKAGEKKYNRVMEVLLRYGGDPNRATLPLRETDGFMRAALTKGETPLHRAAAFCDAEFIEMLLRSGADKEKTDCNGETPLSWASWHLRPGKVLALLTYGKYRLRASQVEGMVSDHGH